MFFIRGDKVTLHTLMKNSLLIARCSANHYNEQSGICKTGLSQRNHSWSHCGVNCTCKWQFGTGVTAVQIAQFHLVFFLYELLAYFQNLVRSSWVDIWFSQTTSESSAFFTSCFMCFRSRPSFTFWEERPGDTSPSERTDLPTLKYFHLRRMIGVWHLLKRDISKSASLRKIMNESRTGRVLSA